MSMWKTTYRIFYRPWDFGQRKSNLESKERYSQREKTKILGWFCICRFRSEDIIPMRNPKSYRMMKRSSSVRSSIMVSVIVGELLRRSKLSTCWNQPRLIEVHAGEICISRIFCNAQEDESSLLDTCKYQLYHYLQMALWMNSFGNEIQNVYVTIEDTFRIFSLSKS